MIKQKLHTLYRSLNTSGRELLAKIYSFIPVALRKKRGFWGYLDFLLKSQWRDSDWHTNYQTTQLRELISYIASEVPYYQELFSQLRLDCRDIRQISDLRQLPVLNKNTLIESTEQFIPRNFPRRRLTYYSTSGSTGRPFKFPQDYKAIMCEEAFAVRHWINAGLLPQMQSVYLRSYVPGSNESLYHYDSINKRHYFSSHHLSQTNCHTYLEKMIKIKADYIFGYPSSLEILADHVIATGTNISFKKAITGSETLTDKIRDKIKQAFGASVHDWYGLAEPAITMAQCEHNNGYHLHAEYGICELIDFEGNTITRPGAAGRIIATNFTNKAMPLIRYDTGDMAIYKGESCPCGRGLPILVDKIIGRKDDYLIGNSGQFIPSVNFYTLFARLDNQVTRFQLIQKSKDRFQLKLIKGPMFNNDTVKTINSGMINRIGADIKLKIDPVEKINPGPGGKIRPVIREFKYNQAV